jgi:hypothetical protein
VESKNHLPAGRHENKGKHLRILLPIQIQLLDIENSKKAKIDSSYYTDERKITFF